MCVFFSVMTSEPSEALNSQTIEGCRSSMAVIRTSDDRVTLRITYHNALKSYMVKDLKKICVDFVKFFICFELNL